VEETLTLAVLLAVYALVASRLERLRITGPMFFLVLGAVCGSAGLDVLPVTASSEPVKVLAEVTLALLLFADASTISLRRARQDIELPERLLLLGLPLTILFGAIVAFGMFPGYGWETAALIGAMLAPTDAALGLAVVTNRAVPVRIRRLLNIESGLNDGLATPFVMLFIALVVAEQESAAHGFVLDAVKEIGIAVAVAIAVGVAGGWLMSRARAADWSSPHSEELTVMALAFIAYSGAVAAGGNGFVAAFLGGVFFGARRHELVEKPIEFTETSGLFLSYLVWAMFGATIVGPVLSAGVDLKIVGYAVLSLTFVRMVPVALSLLGSGLRRETAAFVGWFGPRGLASAVFTFLAIEAFQEVGATDLSAFVTAVAAWTILLSVIAHGMTAAPLATRYGRRMAQLGAIPEMQPGPEPRVRRQQLPQVTGDRPVGGS
jgi:NhaP-type Na+/H+ or K+/H+ antiporter